jgi:hypothetical protein
LCTLYTESLLIDRLKQLDVKQIFGLPGKPKAPCRGRAVGLSDVAANHYRIATIRL